MRTKYAWPKWEESFEDPVSGRPWTFRQIVQGTIDNFLDRESEWSLASQRRSARSRRRSSAEESRAGADRPVASAGHGLQRAEQRRAHEHAGLRRRFAGALPAAGAGSKQPVATFAALQNAKQIFEGAWSTKSYDVVKKGKTRSYKIEREPAQVADAPGASAQHSHCLRTLHRRRPARPGHHRADRDLGAQQFRRAEAPGYRHLFLHPQDAEPARGAHRGEAAGASGRHHRRSRRHLQDQDSVRGGQWRPLPTGDRLDLPAAPAGHQRRPLGLSWQPHRDVEGRSERRLS